MRQYLIPNEGKFYKANMHTHTTCSDGRQTPEEVKATYRAQGYSVIAYTDHNIMIDHSDLNDENFLAITGYEVDTNYQLPGEDQWQTTRTYHLNFYAPCPNPNAYPCANPVYVWGKARELIQDYYKGDYQRRYGVEGQNDMIARANEQGFLVSYNHPSWSLQGYDDYAGLEGLCTLEVYNHGCVLAGFGLDASDHVLQDMLMLGKRVFPVATDDNHTWDDTCGGWISVKAAALTYEDYMAAFRHGDFYASWGPAIHDLWMEDGVLHVECGEVQTIYLYTDRRHTACRTAGDAPLTHAEFNLKTYFNEVHRGGGDSRGFVRLVLVDKNGRKAMTRGYFADELSAEARGIDVE